MTRSRGVGISSALSSWTRSPVVVPVGAALLAVALLSGIGWVAVHQADSTVQRDAQTRVRSNRDAAVRALVRDIDDYQRTVATASVSKAVIEGLRAPTPADVAPVQDELSALARSQNSPAAFLSDTKGRIVATFPAQPALIGKDFSFRDWFQGASLTGRPYVSSAYISAADGHPLVVGVSAPVVDGSRRVGYVTVLWQLESVRAVADGAHRDDDVTITVTDQRGQPLTGSLNVDGRGQPLQAPISAATTQALAGRSVSTIHDGVLEAAGPVPGSGWTVTASQPASVALAPAAAFQQILRRTVGVALLLLLLATIFASLVALRRAADRVALRDSEERLRLLVDGTHDYQLFMLDPQGRIMTWNLGAERIQGYTEAEAVGQDFSVFYTDDQRKAGNPGQDLELTRTKDRLEQQAWRVRKDGTQFWANVILTTVYDEHSSLRGFIQVTRDLTESQKIEAKFEGLLEAAPDAMVGVDPTGAIRFVNRQTEALFGYDRDNLLGQSIEMLLPESSPLVHAGHSAADPANPETRAMGEGLELGGRRIDGTTFPATVSLSSIETEDGLLVIAAVRDITERQFVEQVLRDGVLRFRRVFDESILGKFLVNSDGAILRVNATLSKLVGGEPQEFIGQPLDVVFDDNSDQARVLDLIKTGEGELRAEMALSDTHGHPLCALVALTWIRELDGERVLLAQVEDITARRAAEQRLNEYALHDELTGLPNRRLLLERCEHAFDLARSGRSNNTSVAALFIDLDGFKAVNDRAGHDAGDQVLIDVANDLKSMLRPTDTVARIGGDEFIVLLEQDDGLEHLRTVAGRITAAIRRQITTDTDSLPLSASVGIARVDLVHEPEVSPDQLLRRADAAMYRAKERGRDQYDVFDTDLLQRTEARQVLVQAIRDGLRHDRVALVFQPVIDVDSNIIVGAEALMRLTNAEGRLMPTLPAIVAAEVAGLAEAVGDRVLHLALEAASTWPAHMSLAVNVSARELTGRDLRIRVEQALQRHDFDPTRLVLEITESSILRAGPSALAELERLRRQGVRVAIDDFGTAYATLRNLTILPVDVLKVDASFTAGLPHQRTHTAIVHGVASMAFELDIPCIVEGVETEAQLQAIRGMDVLAQGWYWGMPQGPGVIPMLNPVRLPITRPDATLT
ncbi:MAG: PAS domain S-box protein [Phycicoccus sp.]|nr:PAS domain S-box protein [Phycicoccus sp.]